MVFHARIRPQKCHVVIPGCMAHVVYPYWYPFWLYAWLSFFQSYLTDTSFNQIKSSKLRYRFVIWSSIQAVLTEIICNIHISCHIKNTILSVIINFPSANLIIWMCHPRFSHKWFWTLSLYIYIYIWISGICLINGGVRTPVGTVDLEC